MLARVFELTDEEAEALRKFLHLNDTYRGNKPRRAFACQRERRAFEEANGIDYWGNPRLELCFLIDAVTPRYWAIYAHSKVNGARTNIQFLRLLHACHLERTATKQGA